MNKDILDILAIAGSESYTLATVVGTEGSSYRRPGARMLIGDHGRLAGSVSGGCLERSLVQRGQWLAAGGPKLLRLSTHAEPDETELAYPGCGGTVEILLENLVAAPGHGDDVIGLLRWIRDSRAPAVLATAIRGSADVPVASRAAMNADGHRLGAGGATLWTLCQRQLERALSERTSFTHRYVVAGGEVEVWMEYIAPARELLLCGRHHDVAPVVEMAHLLGWQVTVAAGTNEADQLGRPDAIIEPTGASVTGWTRTRPGAAVVIMTHSLALDRQLLGALLGDDEVAKDLAYLGLLGPRHRTDDILDELAREGLPLSAAARARLRAPVGLDLGGDGPAAVALSLTAEIQAVWSQRNARPLVERAHASASDAQAQRPPPGDQGHVQQAS